MFAPLKSSLRAFGLAVGLLSLTSCSPANFWSANAGYGALAGTAVGSGIGAIIGQQHGHMAANILANGALGTLGGLAAGGLYNAMQPVDHSMDDVVERQAVSVNSNQAEIDALRQQVDDAGRWGRNETKPWEERYLGANPNAPYQGPGIEYDRYLDK